MSKKVQLKVRVDANGKIHAKPEGTQGEECLNLMRFLDKIPGLFVEETKRTDDMLHGGGGVSAHTQIEN